MVLKLIWTEEALFGFEEILSYVEGRFGEIPAKKYAEQIDQLLFRLTSFPNLGKVQEEKLQIRGLIFNKRTTILYLVDGDYLRLLNIFDNRIPIK